jgi:hypothetical protein
VASQPTWSANWSGEYAPCDHHADLVSQRHVDLAVRFSTANRELAQQFARAMDFWTRVLDLDWHRVDSQDCAIQLVDGTPAVFDFCRCMSARSQLPDKPAFQGWIAFNPRLKLTRHEMFLDSVHEIGHLLGLPHNPSDQSVMFAFGNGKASFLDRADLRLLAARHQLRARILAEDGGVKVNAPGGSRGQGWLESAVSRTESFRFRSEASPDATSSGNPRY